MKPKLSRISNDPSTTVRHYSLFVDAHDALMEAQEVKNAAYTAADKEPTRANIQAFMDASKAVTAAEENFEQVRLMKKYLKGTVRNELQF